MLSECCLNFAIFGTKRYIMGNISYKPIVVSSNKRTDGSYVVVIRVTFKRQNRRLPTTLVCTSKDLTRSLKIKNPDVLKNAEILIARMRAATDGLSFYDLEDKDVDWVVSRIKDTLQGEKFSLDFFSWADRFIQSKIPSTRAAYVRALNAFERFLGERSIDVNDITKLLLLDFVEFVEDEPKMHYNRAKKTWEKTDKQKVGKTSSSLHLMKLQHIFNAAKDRYNDEDADQIRIPRSPFDSIKKEFPAGENAQKPLDRSVIQQIISAKTADPSVRVALDAFVVSFGLMGANLADLFAAPEFQGETWVYNRQKTMKRRKDKALMKVDIPVQLRPYVERLRGAGPYWLNELHRIGEKKHTCNEKINQYLRRWQTSVGAEDFTFYAARHSFATIARAQGIDLATVNDLLCHKDSLEMGRRYASLTWEQKNDVNRQVIESFTWE